MNKKAEIIEGVTTVNIANRSGIDRASWSIHGHKIIYRLEMEAGGYSELYRNNGWVIRPQWLYIYNNWNQLMNYFDREVLSEKMGDLDGK